MEALRRQLIIRTNAYTSGLAGNVTQQRFLAIRELNQLPGADQKHITNRRNLPEEGGMVRNAKQLLLLSTGIKT
jgi:hypothetical protein